MSNSYFGAHAHTPCPNCGGGRVLLDYDDHVVVDHGYIDRHPCLCTDMVIPFPAMDVDPDGDLWANARGLADFYGARKCSCGRRRIKDLRYVRHSHKQSAGEFRIRCSQDVIVRTASCNHPGPSWPGREN